MEGVIIYRILFWRLSGFRHVWKLHFISPDISPILLLQDFHHPVHSHHHAHENEPSSGPGPVEWNLLPPSKEISSIQPWLACIAQCLLRAIAGHTSRMKNVPESLWPCRCSGPWLLAQLLDPTKHDYFSRAGPVNYSFHLYGSVRPRGAHRRGRGV